MSFVKLADKSSELSLHVDSCITTKEQLFQVLRQHLQKLFDGKSTDEKVFWATYTVYVIQKDRICLCSRIGTGYSIFDVNVVKSDETNILVQPYKIDGYQEYTLRELKIWNIPIEGEISNLVTPLEVLGWQEDLTLNWEGTIWVRSNFTEWNVIWTSCQLE